MKICQSKAVKLYDFRQIDLSQYAEPFSMREEEMTERLNKLRMRHAAMTEAETVAEDDFVTLDAASELPRFQKTGVTLRVGKGLYDAGLERAILGMRSGETRTLALPEGEVRVTLRAIQRRQLPPLNDETVAAWGLEGVTSLEALRAKIRDEAKAQYAADMAEAVAAEVSNEANDRGSFSLDAEELRAVEAEGQAIAEDMLRSAGLDPATATDEAVMAVSGRTKQEHYEFLRTLCRKELRSAATGAELMAQDGVEIPAGVYDEAVGLCAEGMGISRQEAEKILTFPKFLRQFAANYYFGKILNHVSCYLNKEEEQ